MDGQIYLVITRDEAAKLVVETDERFAIKDLRIRGEAYRVFANAPANLYQLLTRQAELFGERELLVFEDERYTYERFRSRVDALAAALRSKCGVRAGDRVAIVMRNFPEYLIAVFAISAIGGIVVYMNAWWTAEELEYGFADCGAKLAFVDLPRSRRLNAFDAKMTIKQIGVRDASGLDWFFDDLVAKEVLPGSSAHEVATDDDYSIMYTSGSTGYPKGVVTTHRGVISAVWSWLMILPTFEAMGVEIPVPRDEQGSPLVPANLITVPFFHVSGMNTCFILPLCQGGKAIILAKWDPAEAVRLIEAEKVTRFWGVPTMSAELAAEALVQGARLASLSSIDAGGAKRPAQQVGELAATLPKVAPSTGYGMTETSGLGLGLSGDDYVANPEAAGRLVHPLQDMKIVADDGSEVANGEIGELALRSPSIMRCYLNRPEETAQILKNGWMHTGDLAYQNEDGLLFIAGRKKDIIIRGGENIACLDVEAAIYRYPDVSEVAVFPVPDERLGETVGAAVHPRNGASINLPALRSFLAEHIASFKLPEYVWVLPEPLPRGDTEKIDKKALRAWCLASDAGQEASSQGIRAS